MKFKVCLNFFKTLTLILILSINVSCQKKISSSKNINDSTNYVSLIEEHETTKQTYKLSTIDLSHWKVTLPVGKPSEVFPPKIFNYATNEVLKPYMYNDSINGAIVFYAYPDATTENSTRSRCELRELMNPEDRGATNWTFEQGGYMRGTLSIGDISKDEDNNYHETIVMQIHGRLTNEQRDLIGKIDNDMPPVLRISWDEGKIKIQSKVLKNVNASFNETLYADAWSNKFVTIPEYVGFDKFTLEIQVSKGRIEVALNNKTAVVYDDIHMDKWGVFENYFKAGNCLVSNDKGAFAKVKYYDLEINH